MELITRPQLIEEARKNLSSVQELLLPVGQTDEYGGFTTEETRLRVAQTAALIAIADALDALLRNGITVERP